MGFLKLNYDRVSKGNPGQEGIGGIFRNSQGSMCKVYVMDLGFSMNNEAELMVVKQGLTIFVQENYHRVIIKGDSAMVTGVLRKFQQGTSWEKTSKNWQTMRLIQEIGLVIRDIGYLIPMHVCRGGNKAADYLVN